jgi:hypothetical protein
MKRHRSEPQDWRGILERLVLACELTGLQHPEIDWLQSNWDGPLQAAQRALGRCGAAFERQHETLEFLALQLKRSA